ncbi:RNA-directed DNA polymerase, eukaryota [Tanacetum coccineum]
MTDSLPTRFNISCRGICIDSILCDICNTGVETSRHLFFLCELARDVMNLIIRWWNVSFSVFESYEEWLEWFVNIRLPSKNKKMFEGVFYVTWWLLWWFRNKTIFEFKTIKKAMFFDEVLDLVVVNSVRKLLLSDSCEELEVVGMVGLGDIQSNLDLLSDIEIEFGCSDNMDNNKHDVPLGPK